MMPFEFILLGLAVWRFSYMLVKEDGMFRLVYHARVFASRSPHLSELLSCVYCTSVWVTMGLLLLRVAVPSVFEVITYIGAISAVAIFLQVLLMKG